jgi:hypothetical protein
VVPPAADPEPVDLETSTELEHAVMKTFMNVAKIRMEMFFFII